ncbi:cation:proton antiporter regulatory subunit [Streptomyces flavidovirens]|uniref:cation:proton antiporter regulatory subunit n=1 Tax=Streptomyces flavidovirens TaxID=67298 RepID=UPI0004266649|nr:TrkA C-terminal domain-containing protein [Streptomyces flavidovirens]
MIGVLSFFVVIILSLLINRVATVALVLTGMSREAARFQARSTFSGVGFTTSEAETMVSHPVRRRIAMTLMLLGSAGMVSVVASLLLSFTGLHGRADGLLRLGIIVGGLGFLLIVLRTAAADRWLTHVLQRLLRRFTTLEARDYAGLLHLSDNWMVGELRVCEDHRVVDQPLRRLDLRGEGVLVLGIQRRSGRWVGAPRPETCLRAGDVMVLYGPREVISDLDVRRRDSSAEVNRAAARARFQQELVRQQETDDTAP